MADKDRSASESTLYGTDLDGRPMVSHNGGLSWRSDHDCIVREREAILTMIARSEVTLRGERIYISEDVRLALIEAIQARAV